MHLRRIQTFHVPHKDINDDSLTNNKQQVREQDISRCNTITPRREGHSLCLHSAFGSSTYAEAFILLQPYPRTHTSSATHIHHGAHSFQVCTCMGRCARVRTHALERIRFARAPMFPRFLRTRNCTARFDRACVPGCRKIQTWPGRL